jgi:hypothetical protein
MEAEAVQNSMRDLAKSWVTVLRTCTCLDAAGRELPFEVEEWPVRPYAPAWSPYYATARRLQKRWKSARARSQRPAAPAIKSTAGREHRTTAASHPAPVESNAEPPGAREDAPLSAAEQKLIRFLCREAVATWTRKN